MPNVKGYRITYMSTSDAPWQADIRCYGSTDLRAPEVALIRFFADPATIPADSWVGGQVNGVPIVNYPLDRFSDVITMLRDDTYLGVDTFFYTSGYDPVKGWGISSGMEPIGDMNP